MRTGSNSPKKLASLVSTYPICGWYGTREVYISSIEYDSRKVTPSSCFVALPGFHSDGQHFIADAVSRGALAIICRKRPEHINPNVAYIVVNNPRRAFSKFSDAFWDSPSRSIYVIGISGTDGKSTTVQFLHQLLEASGHATGFISTVARKNNDKTTLNTVHLSTPEAFELQQSIANMRDSKKEYAVIEATSHALSKQTMRLESVHFSAGLICNISHEHLDFHGSFAQYRNDKAELFRTLPRNAVAVLNANDPNAHYCSSQSPTRPLYFALAPTNTPADLLGKIVEDDLHHSSIDLAYKGKQRRCTLPFAAALNADNVLAALLAAGGVLDVSPLELAELIPTLRLPVGRMMPISLPASTPAVTQQAHGMPSIFIDYAHTPAAFERLFPFVRAKTYGQLIAVFGSAGERDVQKRPMLGRIAGQYADVIILCDEDPRKENSMDIIDDIATGLNSSASMLHRIPDRQSAIEYALSLARNTDTVLILGKGHEQSILYNSYTLPWDEENITRALLKRQYEKR